MENFKKTIRMRSFLSRIYAGLVVVFIACLNLFVPHANNFQIGFTLGLALATEIFVLLLTNQYSRALGNETALKQLYIQEHDERTKAMKAQIGALGLNTVIALLTLATIISGFFHPIVFFTLFFVLLCSVLVKGCLKIYIKKKG